MAFPTLDLLSDSLIEAQRIAKSVKTLSQSLLNDSQSQNVRRQRVLNYINQLGNHLARLTAIRDVPGIGAYAQSQFSNGALDITAEFNTLRTQIQGTIDWAVANFPQSNGFALVDQLNANGTTTQGTFSPTQLATLRTQLQGLIAVIE